MKLGTKIRVWLLAGLLTLGVIIYADKVPTGWLTDQDDGSREITLIGLSSNDTLQITAKVTSSIHGVVLDVHALPVGGNSWDFTFTVSATEHVRVSLDAIVRRDDPRDRPTVRCRIEDNGDKVDEDKVTVGAHRQVAIAGCGYVS